jgi:hypothetical protein
MPASCHQSKKEKMLMSKANYGLTPEQMLKRKKRNKYIMYSMIFLGTVLISAIVTVLANQI